MGRLTDRKINLNISLISLNLIYCCSLLTGIVSDRVLACIMLVFLCLVFFDDNFYLAFPCIMVYYEYLVLPGGLSLYRVYTFMLIFKLIFSKRRLFLINENFVCVIIILIYSCIAIIPVNIRVAVFAMLDVLAVFLLISGFVNTENNIKRCMSYYVIACLCSCISGIVIGNFMGLSYALNSQWSEVSRFMATFVDPNYMGLYFNIAIFSCLSLRLFNKILRYIFVAALIVAMISSVSFTGAFGLILVGMVYLIIEKKIRPSVIVLIIIVGFICFALYQYGVENRDAPIIGSVSYRVKSYIQNYESSGDSSLAVSRLNIYKTKLKLIEEQGLLKTIFGVNVANPLINTTSYNAAHNDYIDMLYNFGILGFLAFYAALIIKTVRSFMSMSNTPNEKFRLLVRVAWFYYAVSLSLLMESKFYLFLFL